MILHLGVSADNDIYPIPSFLHQYGRVFTELISMCFLLHIVFQYSYILTFLLLIFCLFSQNRGVSLGEWIWNKPFKSTYTACGLQKTILLTNNNHRNVVLLHEIFKVTGFTINWKTQQHDMITWTRIWTNIWAGFLTERGLYKAAFHSWLPHSAFHYRFFHWRFDWRGFREATCAFLTLESILQSSCC